MLTSISARFKGEPCCAWLGENGAGHFVKTIHNGIEYADMQMIAEIYGMLRDGLGCLRKLGDVFGGWNKGRLKSYLIEISAEVLAADDPITGRPMVDMILDKAGQKGTGKWSAIEAQNMGIPATAIEAAVAARSLSSMKGSARLPRRSWRDARIDANPISLRGDLELALFAGKIGAYAQGFAVMAGPRRNSAGRCRSPDRQIWRAGCIIRSQFLDDITSAFAHKPRPISSSCPPSPPWSRNRSCAPPRRCPRRPSRVAVPALASALTYFDTYRHGRGTANLIQAQRDFFGAHGFDRVDGVDKHHGPWAAARRVSRAARQYVSPP